MRLVWIALVALLAGCGVGVPPPAAPTTGTTTDSGCSRQVTITDADNGHEVCVAVGGTVTVNLAGGWKPPTVTGDALVAAAGGYTAARTGNAEVSSSRSACPPPSPGAAACHAVEALRVTVIVR